MTGSRRRYTRPMNESLSKFLFGLSIFVCTVAVLLTALWFYILATSDGWGGFAFIVIVPWIAGGAFLLSAVPSAIMYFRTRSQRDRRSLYFAAVSSLSLGAEVLATFVVPLRHGC